MSFESEEQEQAFERERQLRSGSITAETKAEIARLTADRKSKGLALPAKRSDIVRNGVFTTARMAAHPEEHLQDDFEASL